MCSLPEWRMFSKSLLENFFYFIFNRIDFANFLYLPTESDRLPAQDLFTLPCVHLSFWKHLWDFTQTDVNRWDGATKNGEDFVGLLSSVGQQHVRFEPWVSALHIPLFLLTQEAPCSSLSNGNISPLHFQAAGKSISLKTDLSPTSLAPWDSNN